MSKSILVLDTPKYCGECPICASWQASAFSNREYWCTVSNNTSVDQYDKPNWCPLKSMPEKIDVPNWDDSIKAENTNAEVVGIYMYDRGIYRGYNGCIDQIIGE